MKITIDTKEDSKHEIRKAIQMLTNLVGEGARTNVDMSANRTSAISDHAQERAGRVLDIFSSGSDSEDNSRSDSEVRDSSESSESSGNAFADMFGNSESKPEDEANTIDLSGFANLATSKKEKKETDDDGEVEVVSY